MEKRPENYFKNRITFFFSIFISTFIFFACHEPEKKTIPISSPKPKVSVAKPPVKNNKKKIYLTFDDGPNKGTPNVMAVIKKENVPATFFIVGEHVFKNSSQHATWDSLLTMQNIVLCNHSYTHAWHNHFQKFYNHPDSVIEDFDRTQDSLHFKNNIVRAPGRNCWRVDSIRFTDIKKSKKSINALAKSGLVILGWDLEWHFDSVAYRMQYKADKVLYQIDSVFKRRKTKMPGNLVLLAHDQMFQDQSGLAELKKFIHKLKQNEDYELLLVTDYPDMEKAMAGSLKNKHLH